MNLLMLGHSILAFYKQDHLGSWKLTNVSKQGVIAKEGYQRLLSEPELLNGKDAVLIMFGINELYYQMKVESIIINLKKMIEFIREQNKEIPIILCHVIQTAETNRLKPDRIESVNLEMDKLAKEYSTLILDWQALYRDQGEIQPEYTLDGIHLSKKGYDLFSQTLLDLLNNNISKE